jgi:cytochrome c
MLVSNRVSNRYRLAAVALYAALLAFPGLVATASTEPTQKYGLGTPATQEQIAGWDIDVFADGRNLPAGSGTVMAGRDIYTKECLSCHGAQGEGGIGDRLAGGMGTLASAKPVRTVGSFWPYAPTLYDYIRRTMPLTAPQSLSNDETYAVTGYVLFLNGLLKEDAQVDAKTLADLKMPNRNGFVPDPRPDVKGADTSGTVK